MGAVVGNELQLTAAHVLLSCETMVRYPKRCWMKPLTVVPTELRTIDCGDERYPLASITVTSCPGIVVLDTCTGREAPFCSPDVSSWSIEVLSLIILLMSYIEKRSPDE
jgi:hypothetical protein